MYSFLRVGNIIVEDDNKQKLSFAFQNLNEIPRNLLPENLDQIEELDLTENNLNGSNDLKFLFEFSNLKTLILDKNQIQSNIKLPVMKNLTTMWLNHNKIENLSIFIENLALSCPNLVYLSMMNNKAAPSYFNGGSLIEYNDYRLYVISKLINLKILDSKEVTLEERSQSQSIYGSNKITNKTKESNINRRRSTQASGSVTNRNDDLASIKKDSEPKRKSSIKSKTRKDSIAKIDKIDSVSVLNEEEVCSILPDIKDTKENLDLEKELAHFITNENLIHQNKLDLVEKELIKSPPSPALSMLVDLESLLEIVGNTNFKETHPDFDEKFDKFIDNHIYKQTIPPTPPQQLTDSFSKT